MRTITPSELDELRRQGAAVDLIDVRSPGEYRTIRAESARSIPLDRLVPRAVMEARDAPADQPLYTICQSGARSRQAVERFHRAGYRNVVHVEGGTLAWERAGLPVIRGAPAMALERQVRITAGSLVVLGVGLGVGLHPGFLGLAAFVGAGLVFAGLTDTCGMGLILARMPWNRAPGRGDQVHSELDA